MIEAVGVVIPAHNEESRIGVCLDSVRWALGRVPAGIRTELCVVQDSCTDRTPEVVAGRLRGWPGAHVVSVRHRPSGTGVGQVRDIGVRMVLRRLGTDHPERVWLLNTDADTTVPASWVAEQLRYAMGGAHGVAGLAELRRERRLSGPALARYREIVSSGLRGATHGHVYGANLGVRADAYLRCGGFPARGHGEEHHLWRALADAGCRLHQPSALRVSTSGRTVGRARGGLADLLRSLEHGDAAGWTAEPAV
jgi:glycosyltransferase involved in cell wall biosynthesis